MTEEEKTRFEISCQTDEIRRQTEAIQRQTEALRNTYRPAASSSGADVEGFFLKCILWMGISIAIFYVLSDISIWLFGVNIMSYVLKGIVAVLRPIWRLIKIIF